MVYHRSLIPGAGLLVSAALYLLGYFLTSSDFVRHMILHITIMGPIACLCALLLTRVVVFPGSGYRDASGVLADKLWLATGIQLLMFLGFHAPFVYKHLHTDSAYFFAMTAMLFVSMWYWSAILWAEKNHGWQAIISLLVTGKLFCMIAVLLIFSPRSLYSNLHHVIDIGEQQLAGLIMIVVCPLSYVVTAILLFMRWLAGIEDSSGLALSIFEDEKP